MKDEEIESYFRESNEKAEREAELSRIKAQLLKRVSRAIMRAIPGIAEEQPSWFGSRIPERLRPKNISGRLVVDVVTLPGQICTHLIINSDGYVIDREYHMGEEEVPAFRADNVYAIRIRSGFLGRIGFTFWRSICG